MVKSIFDCSTNQIRITNGDEHENENEKKI